MIDTMSYGNSSVHTNFGCVCIVKHVLVVVVVNTSSTAQSGGGSFNIGNLYVVNPFNTSGKLRFFHTLAGLEALQGPGLGHFKSIVMVAAGVDGGSAKNLKSGVPPTLPLERNVGCQSHAFASIKCCQA